MAYFRTKYFIWGRQKETFKIKVKRKGRNSFKTYRTGKIWKSLSGPVIRRNDAGLLGTGWNSKRLDYLLENVLHCSHEYVKPDGMLLGYPVITSGIDAHRASFERSLGEKYDEFIDEVSIEKRVDKDTPPAFIWHTCEDKTVPLENSLLMVEALRKQEIPFDYHVYAKGTHGLGLGTRETATKNMGHYEPQVSTWTECFKQWMGVMYE